MSKQKSKTSACGKPEPKPNRGCGQPNPPESSQKGGCGKPTQNVTPDSLTTLVNDYWAHNQHVYDHEDPWWTEPETWEGVLDRAWCSIMGDGKMHPHQCRIGKEKLKNTVRIPLSENKSLTDFETFEELHDWITSVTNKIPGIGTLATYDISRRIGAKYKLTPVLVHLHSGAKEGANHLGIYGKAVHKDQFPDAIKNRLSADHIENFLCIYKKELAQLKHSGYSAHED